MQKAQRKAPLKPYLWLVLLVGALALIISGCNRVPASQPGRNTISTPAGVVSTLEPPAQAAGPTRQIIKAHTLRTYAPPPALPPDAPPAVASPAPSPPLSPAPAAPAPDASRIRGGLLSEETMETISTELPAAHRDQSAEIGARVSAMRPITWAGLALMLGGLAFGLHPALRLILGGGKQLPLAAAGLGLCLTFAPDILAGHEGLAIGAVVVLLGGAWLVSRLAHKEGQLDALAAPPSPKA